jgi:hypothetical protein
MALNPKEAPQTKTPPTLPGRRRLFVWGRSRRQRGAVHKAPGHHTPRKIGKMGKSIKPSVVCLAACLALNQARS